MVSLSGNTLFTVFVQLAFGILCDFRLSDLRSRTHLFHKLILIGDGKGAGCSMVSSKLSDRFCPNIVTAASMSALDVPVVEHRKIRVDRIVLSYRLNGDWSFSPAVSTEQKSCQRIASAKRIVAVSVSFAVSVQAPTFPYIYNRFMGVLKDQPVLLRIHNWDFCPCRTACENGS